MDPGPPLAVPAPLVKLVVNADEFGLSNEISRGILAAHQRGVVTSTSVMGTCRDLTGAVASLGQAPTLGVGLHLSLVGGTPVAPANSVGSLLAGNGGQFPANAREHLVRWMKGTLVGDEIEREFAAQITRAQAAGLVLDHLDTHQHIGFLPPVGRAVEAVAKRFGIAGMRSTGEQPTLGWITDLARGTLASLVGGLAWLTRRQLGTLRHGPITWGYGEAGRLDEIRILELIGRLGAGSHELICHPGEADDASANFGFVPTPPFRRSRELAALSSPLIRHAIESRGITLCRWSDLF